MENHASLLAQVNPAMLIVALIVLLGLLVAYYTLLVKAILEMLRFKAHSVLLVFSFLALAPVPFFLIMGIMMIVIWRLHRKTILECTRP